MRPHPGKVIDMRHTTEQYHLRQAAALRHGQSLPLDLSDLSCGVGGWAPQDGGWGPQSGGWGPQGRGWGPQGGGWGLQGGGWGLQDGEWSPQCGEWSSEHGCTLVCMLPSSSHRYPPVRPGWVAPRGS